MSATDHGDGWRGVRTDGEHPMVAATTATTVGRKWVVSGRSAAYVPSVMDDPYRDTDLVELYDFDNPGGPDHVYYRALADEIDARTIVDLGCGTGLLTRSLIGPGRTVIGVDPSRTMLDYARRRPGSEAVTWILGDAAALAQTGTVDLAVCTGNAIMQISPEELPATLKSLAGALRP